MFALSGLAPKGMERPETIIVAIGAGRTLGLEPFQAMQSIAVINGRPSLWGDALLGLVEASGLLEDRQQGIEGEGENRKGWFETKRKGRSGFIRSEFSVADAKKAKLWGKSGPWTDYPDRMLLNRARAFNLRDQFPDVLKGLHVAEESVDIEQDRVIQVQNTANRTQALSAALPSPPRAEEADFAPAARPEVVEVPAE